MPRLLVLCRDPYHLPRRDAQAWLSQELEAGSSSTAMERGGALRDLVADLRLLGMAPTVALAHDADAVELRLE